MEKIPRHAIVLMVGVTGSGKSHWCNNYFSATEILSIDKIRAELCGSALNFTQDHVVWSEIHRRARLILEMGQRVVIDSPNLKPDDREPFIALGAELGVPVFLVFCNEPEVICAERVGNSYMLGKQLKLLEYNIKRIRAANREHVRVLELPESVQVCKGYANQSRILAVGDVHGNWDAMNRAVEYAQAYGLFIVWLGDVVDYGAANLRCMKLAYVTVATGAAHMIWGNHERKIDRWIDSDFGARFRGKLSEANQTTVNEIQSLSADRKARFLAAWRALNAWSTQHLQLGKWCFTHGGVHPRLWGAPPAHRLHGDVGNMAYFGEVDQQDPTRADGYPNRVWNWVNQIPAGHTAVVGHDYLDRENFLPVIKTNDQGGKVICLDTGSGKEGKLSGAVIDLQTDLFQLVDFST